MTHQEVQARILVLEFFKNDAEKTKAWFVTPNPLLGYIKPQDLLDLGREQKLLEFIKTQLKENEK